MWRVASPSSIAYTTYICSVANYFFHNIFFWKIAPTPTHGTQRENYAIFLSPYILREINFGQFRVFKTANFTIVETLVSNFSKFQVKRNVEIH